MLLGDSIVRLPTSTVCQELRIACAVAAMERAGGIFPVVSPFAQVTAFIIVLHMAHPIMVFVFLLI